MWDYGPPIDAVLWSFKYRGLRYLARPLAQALADRHAEALCRAEVIVPVPMPWPRRWRRGYNQAHELAHELGHLLGLPVVQPFRHRFTPRQSSLAPYDRRRNAKRSFELRARFERRPSLWPYRSALLLDDVVTTGSTVNELGRRLRDLGCTRVSAAALAWTAPPQRPRPVR